MKLRLCKEPKLGLTSFCTRLFGRSKLGLDQLKVKQKYVHNMQKWDGQPTKVLQKLLVDNRCDIGVY